MGTKIDQVDQIGPNRNCF